MQEQLNISLQAIHPIAYSHETIICVCRSIILNIVKLHDDIWASLHLDPAIAHLLSKSAPLTPKLPMRHLLAPHLPHMPS